MTRVRAGSRLAILLLAKGRARRVHEVAKALTAGRRAIEITANASPDVAMPVTPADRMPPGRRVGGR